MIYAIKTKSFMNFATKNALIGAGVGGVVGGVGGHFVDRNSKREGNWFKRNKGAVLGALGGATVGGGAGYFLGRNQDAKLAKELELNNSNYNKSVADEKARLSGVVKQKNNEISKFNKDLDNEANININTLRDKYNKDYESLADSNSKSIDKYIKKMKSKDAVGSGSSLNPMRKRIRDMESAVSKNETARGNMLQKLIKSEVGSKEGDLLQSRIEGLDKANKALKGNLEKDINAAALATRNRYKNASKEAIERLKRMKNHKDGEELYNQFTKSKDAIINDAVRNKLSLLDENTFINNNFKDTYSGTKALRDLNSTIQANKANNKNLKLLGTGLGIAGGIGAAAASVKKGKKDKKSTKKHSLIPYLNPILYRN
jgi:hypothetical protein